jgi:hypothetical protein
MTRRRLIDQRSIAQTEATGQDHHGAYRAMLEEELGAPHFAHADQDWSDDPPLYRRPWTLLIILLTSFTAIFCARLARDGAFDGLLATKAIESVRVDTSWMRAGGDVKERAPETLPDTELVPAADREDPNADAVDDAGEEE